MTMEGTLPWTRSCFVCGEDNPHGLKVKSKIKDGSVRIEYVTRAEDVGYREVVHGGIAMTLLDEAMTWAAVAAMKSMCVAAEVTTRLKRPMTVGMHLNVCAWVEKTSRRMCRVEAKITDTEGTLLATAQGKYMPMPPSQKDVATKDFVTGPDTIRLQDLFSDSG